MITGSQTPNQDIFLVAQFDLKGMDAAAAARQFQGQVVTSVEDAVLVLNIASMTELTRDRSTWVVRPRTVGWRWPSREGRAAPAHQLPWRTCRPITLQQIHARIKNSNTIKKPYSHFTNNCQHFAEEMFTKCDQELPGE